MHEAINEEVRFFDFLFKSYLPFPFFLLLFLFFCQYMTLILKFDCFLQFFINERRFFLLFFLNLLPLICINYIRWFLIISFLLFCRILIVFWERLVDLTKLGTAYFVIFVLILLRSLRLRLVFLFKLREIPTRILVHK